METTTDILESEDGDLDHEILLEMFRRMLTIRRFEEKAVELYRAAEFGGTVHPAIGQEAVSVGTCLALRTDDCITSTHRGHGDVIAKGAAVHRVMAELFGRSTGVCKGKGGSMHVADFSVGVIGANGIVCGSLPTADGLALAFKLRGLDRIAVAFFGDGATNQGAFHESLNMAGLWSLPVLFVCQNNQYATCVPRHKHQRVERVSDFARSYGMPGVTVDGNDVVAVYEAVRRAVARARGGGGPMLIDCVTYRWMGHQAGENIYEYRTREEIESWQARDPIENQRRRLLESDPSLADALRRIESEVNEAIAAAVAFARQSPLPDPETADEDVYVGIDIC